MFVYLPPNDFQRDLLQRPTLFDHMSFLRSAKWHDCHKTLGLKRYPDSLVRWLFIVASVESFILEERKAKKVRKASHEDTLEGAKSLRELVRNVSRRLAFFPPIFENFPFIAVYQSLFSLLCRKQTKKHNSEGF